MINEMTINKMPQNKEDNYVINKEFCYGCMVCYNICPYEAIYIIEDEEGFFFPKINQEKCISCGLCRERCPSIHKSDIGFSKEQKGYIAQNFNKEIRISSTSGGVFGALASWCISHDGIVFGAMINDSLKVVHGFSDNILDCAKYRGSKYVQSDIGRNYLEVKKFLEQNKYVLFSGTPCQIGGLHRFLGKQYDKLITVDVVCKGVLSPGLFENYLKFQQQSLKYPITKIMFREKRWGYKYTAMAMYYENDCIYAKGTESDKLLRAFFENNYNRFTCYHCQYRKQNRNSDFTIWDCFNADIYNKEMDDDTGVNKMVVHTKKGEMIIEELAADNALLLYEVPIEKLISENTEAMYEDPLLDERKRKKFFADYNILLPNKLWDKYYPDNLKVKVNRVIRKLLYLIGIYQMIRRIKNRYLKTHIN